MNSFLLTHLRKAHERAREQEAVRASRPEFFRPKSLAMLTRKPVRFTMLSNPWEGPGFRHSCRVLHDGVEKQWEIINEVMVAQMKKVVGRLMEEGKAPDLVGWDVCVRYDHYTHVEFSAPRKG